jgi:hypothetical protein
MIPHKLARALSGILLIAGCVAAGWAAFEGRRHTPRIEITPTTLALTADSDAALDAEIRVTNSGQTDLRLLQVDSDCSCVVVSWPEVVAPGAVGPIRVRITPPRVGERHVKMRIASNAPNEPYATVHAHVRRTIEPPFVIGAPGAAVSIGIFRTLPKDPIEKAFLTYEGARSPHWIHEIVCEGDMLTATLGEVTEKPTEDPNVVQRAYELLIQVNTDVAIGRIHGTIRFMSEEDEVGQLRVFGERLSAVVVAPRYISAFLRDTSASLPDWKVIVSAPKGFDLKTSVETPAELEGWIETEQISSRRWNFRLTKRPSEDIRSKLVFRTNHPESPEVPLDVVIALPAETRAPQLTDASGISGPDRTEPNDVTTDPN